VHTDLAVITGTEDRQHAHVALTRAPDKRAAWFGALTALGPMSAACRMESYCIRATHLTETVWARYGSAMNSAGFAPPPVTHRTRCRLWSTLA
jgi:hypothetical protein